MEFSNERHAAIVDIVSKNHFVTVKDLAKSLGVSEMTIRRDVVVLSENNLVKQVYGGITPTGENSNGKYSLSEEEKKNYDKKRKIAEKALSLLSPNDIIYLDSGTTIQTLSGMIPDTPPDCNYKQLRILGSRDEAHRVPRHRHRRGIQPQAQGILQPGDLKFLHPVQGEQMLHRGNRG